MDKQQIDNLPKSAAVFIIRNMVTDMVYVGITGKLRQRMRQLWAMHESETPISNMYILTDMRLTGTDNFELRVIESAHGLLSGYTKVHLNEVYQKELETHGSLYPDFQYFNEIIEVASRYKDQWNNSEFWDFNRWITSENHDTGVIYTEPNIDLMVKRLRTSESEIRLALSDPDYLVGDRYGIQYFKK